MAPTSPETGAVIPDPALVVLVETLRALWRPGTKAYAGQRVSLPETTCYLAPVAAAFA